MMMMMTYILITQPNNITFFNTYLLITDWIMIRVYNFTVIAITAAPKWWIKLYLANIQALYTMVGKYMWYLRRYIFILPLNIAKYWTSIKKPFHVAAALYFPLKKSTTKKPYYEWNQGANALQMHDSYTRVPASVLQATHKSKAAYKGDYFSFISTENSVNLITYLLLFIRWLLKLQLSSDSAFQRNPGGIKLAGAIMKRFR